MLAYALVGVFLAGIAVRHFVSVPFFLTADAKKILKTYTPLKDGELSADARSIRDAVVAHIDSMKDKSEIMIRHDAGLLRDALTRK